MKRYAQIIHLRPEREVEYRKAHAAVWPEVLKAIHDCNIRNYTIFLRNGVLFAYYEYIGEDHAVDIAKMASDQKTQEWWIWMNPMQKPLEDREPGTWWAGLEEVFHTD